MPFAITADVARYDEAVDWFLARVVMTADEAKRVGTEARRDAFWVGAALQADQVQRVFDHVANALENGEPFEDFRKRVASILRSDAHIETVFRNATQRAYNAGRYQQMRAPDVLRFRPYWLFDAILDSRTTDICEACQNTLLHADDPWWEGHIPPLHHRCRSSIRNLRKSEAEKRGITSPPADPDIPGDWGAPPTKGGGWKPDLKRYDDALAGALERKQELAADPVVGTPHEPEKWIEHYASRYGVAARSLGWGRASLEHGLDLTITEVRALIERLPPTLAKTDLLASLEDAVGTLRASGGELDPAKKAAAAIAGHLNALKPRPDVIAKGLPQEGAAARRAQRFFSVMTGPSVKHPEDWIFRLRPTRAYCSPGSRLIQFRAPDGILEHEWAHALEALNPNLLERATAFLAARTKGEKLIKLHPGEFAWEDHFLNAYIGKRYQKATEITSMAVEVISAGVADVWKGSLVQLTRDDLEHLLFALGQLAG